MTEATVSVPPAGVAPTERRINWVPAAAMMVPILAVIGLVNLGRTSHLTSDQMSVGTMTAQRIDPEPFADDLLYGNPDHYRFYLPWYRTLMTVLTRLTGTIEMAYWTLMMAASAGLMFSTFALLVGLRGPPWMALLGAVLMVLPRLSLGDTMWGAAVMETALPRTLFCIGFPLALWPLWAKRFSGFAVPVGFLGVGLLGNLHPQSGLFATCILGITLLVVHRFRPRGWLLLAVGGAAALVGIVPFLVESAWWMPQLSTPVTDAPKDLGKLLTSISSMSTGIITARWPQKLLVFAACLAPMLLASLVAIRLVDKAERPSALQLALVALVVALCFPLAAMVLKNVLMFYWLDWPTRITWLRGTRFVHAFAVMAVVLALGAAGRWRAGGPGRLRWAIVGLTLVPVIASVAGMELVFASRFQPYQSAARWAARTPQGTRFLIEPYPALAFRFWSERYVPIAEHDVQFFIIGDPEKVNEAAGRVHRLETWYREKDWAAIRDAARAQGYDYVVGPPAMASMMTPVFTDGDRAWIFRVSQTDAKPDNATM